MKISPMRPSSSADDRLLGVTLAAVGQLFTLADHRDALDHLLDDLFREAGGARRHRPLDELLDIRLVIVLVGDELTLQRLRQL